MKIIPGILTNDIKIFNRLAEQSDGVAERVHVDFIDGEYVDNYTLEPIDIDVTRYLASFDAHLMVASHNLEDWVTEVIASGFERVIVQVESVVGQVDLIKKIKYKDCQAGLAIDFPTPVTKISSEVLEVVDTILVMGYKAGFDRQEFRSSTLDKIRELKEIRAKGDYKFTIYEDGGVNPQNIKVISEAGADEVVVGKRVFAPDLQSNLDQLSKSLL